MLSRSPESCSAVTTWNENNNNLLNNNTQVAEVVDPWNENKDNLWNNDDGQAASDWNVNSNDQGEPDRRSQNQQELS